MKKPDFFIIGAPKCGTTSLYHWLAEHPQVYMSPVKEPHFFSVDIFRPDRMKLQQYLSLFDGADDSHKIVGEASTRYLYSEKAVKKILEFNKDSKFIALLRNPIDMVYSLHNHLCFLEVENQRDFRIAWSLSDDRSKGKYIPDGCNDPHSLLYKKIGLIGEQVERFFNEVSPEKRMVVLLDDLQSDQSNILSRILSFLEIDPVDTDNFRQLNKSMAKRSRYLSLFIKYMAKIKQGTGIQRSFKVLRVLKELNRKTKQREPLPEDLRRQMALYFENDIELLSTLLGRDLSHYLK